MTPEQIALALWDYLETRQGFRDMSKLVLPTTKETLIEEMADIIIKGTADGADA